MERSIPSQRGIYPVDKSEFSGLNPVTPRDETTGGTESQVECRATGSSSLHFPPYNPVRQGVARRFPVLGAHWMRPEGGSDCYMVYREREREIRPSRSPLHH